ncbi:hypothetical protein [Lentibacillus saliphilus]|uniref:hypothetical protein n=1 Tax=Lentibacillus saliphilus TaxID=2737028 RepID=UPI001C2F83F4|nr:hypothetical protein [Lentibacillus saliphilus]
MNIPTAENLKGSGQKSLTKWKSEQYDRSGNFIYEMDAHTQLPETEGGDSHSQIGETTESIGEIRVHIGGIPERIGEHRGSVRLQ